MACCRLPSLVLRGSPSQSPSKGRQRAEGKLPTGCSLPSHGVCLTESLPGALIWQRAVSELAIPGGCASGVSNQGGSMKRQVTAALLAAGAAVGICAAMAGPVTAAGRPALDAPAGPRWTIVARHLDNPRGVGFTPTGWLVVTESGHAGNRCLSGPQLGQYCAGLTSKISAISLNTHARRVLASGLPSAFFPFEPFGLGGVSVSGQRIFAVTALPPQEIGPHAAACAGMPPSCKAFARVLRARVGLLIRVGHD